MFQKIHIKKVLTTVACLALLAACGEVPQVEVDAATKTLNEAEVLGATSYAPAELAEAKQASEAVSTELAAQADKYAVFRSYDRTRELAVAAEQVALKARTAAEAGKAKAETDANGALQALTGAEATAAAMLSDLGACKRKPKGFAADLETLAGTLSGFTIERAGVESAIASEDYLGALELTAPIQAQVDSLISEMAEAKVKIGC